MGEHNFYETNAIDLDSKFFVLVFVVLEVIVKNFIGWLKVYEGEGGVGQDF